jgi:hypothetical protein
VLPAGSSGCSSAPEEREPDAETDKRDAGQRLESPPHRASAEQPPGGVHDGDEGQVPRAVADHPNSCEQQARRQNGSIVGNELRQKRNSENARFGIGNIRYQPAALANANA